MKNTGRPSEKAFEAYFKGKGKDAFIHRFVDAAEIRGRTGVVGQARAQPSDYIIVVEGRTIFAEVKSTTHKTAFAFSLLRKVQTASAIQIMAADGTYHVFIHSLAKSQWYSMPYSVVIDAQIAGKSSIKWEDLEQWRITIHP